MAKKKMLGNFILLITAVVWGSSFVAQTVGGVLGTFSFNGIRSAHAAGMIPLMVPDLAMPNEEMREKSHRIFDTLLDVKNWLTEGN